MDIKNLRDFIGSTCKVTQVFNLTTTVKKCKITGKKCKL